MPGVSPDSPPSPAAGDAETQAYFERRLSWLGPWGYEWTMKFKQDDVQLKSDQTKGTSIVLHHILFLNREQCFNAFLFFFPDDVCACKLRRRPALDSHIRLKVEVID